MRKAVSDLAIQQVGLPDRLRNFRKEHRLSLDALAIRLGIKAYTVRRWELGAARPSRELADVLAGIGFGPISDEETNLASRSRVKTRQGQASAIASEREVQPVPGLPGATYPAWVANGPPDQEDFYTKLIQLQLSSAVDPEHLSIIDQYLPGLKTAQSALEAPKSSAASWNSNYGSHGWHRYVGRFPPHVVRSLLNHFGVGPDSLVCDPFSGSGTTAVECRLLGIPFIGIEIGALSHLMGKVKAAFAIDPNNLLNLANKYEAHFQTADQAFKASHAKDFCVSDVLTRERNPVPTFSNIERWFTPQAFLGVSLTVEYAELLDENEREALLFALSAKMRSIGNVDVDVVRAEYSKKPRENVDVCKLVVRHLKKMANDVRAMAKSHAGLIGPASSVRLIEGSALSVALPAASIDAIVTSPPYGVEALSYLRTHLLSYRSLASELNHDPYEVRDQTIGSEYLEESVVPTALKIESASSTFAAFFGNLVDIPDKKTRQRRAGMMKFFEDMHEIGLRMSDWLKDGGKVAWVIGNKRLGETIIPTDKIIEESFASSGLELYDIIRHKLKTNNSNSQVPWQERIIQEEAIMLFRRSSRV